MPSRSWYDGSVGFLPASSTDHVTTLGDNCRLASGSPTNRRGNGLSTASGRFAPRQSFSGCVVRNGSRSAVASDFVRPSWPNQIGAVACGGGVPRIPAYCGGTGSKTLVTTDGGRLTIRRNDARTPWGLVCLLPTAYCQLGYGGGSGGGVMVSCSVRESCHVFAGSMRWMTFQPRRISSLPR